jgi:hypothetical protein
MSAPGAADPHLLPDDQTARVIRAWVAVYTKGLPAELALDRQAVIEADLWEEAEAARWLGETPNLARQRWSRWIRGLPADVTWRLEQQRRVTKMPRRTDMRISKAQLAAIGVVTILYVVMIAGLMASSDFREWAGMGLATFGLALSVVGLLLAIPRPQAGFVVGIIGTGVALLSMPWLFPFFLPLPIVLGYRLLRELADAYPSAPGA